MEKISDLEVEKLLLTIIEKINNLEVPWHTNQPYKNKFYRNKDLKKIFGLSSNTIIKYRELGILPYTFIGDIYLYPISSVEEVLRKNSSQ